MKNFGFLFCFVLCVLPCVFTQEEKMDKSKRVAKSLDISKEDLQECLNKVDTDLDTMLDISDSALSIPTQSTDNPTQKVGCFGACVFKKNGMMINSKIMPEKLVELVSRVTRNQEHIPLLRTAATVCSQQVSTRTDECDIAFSFSRCVVQDLSLNNH